jgi:hypothetical protein
MIAAVPLELLLHWTLGLGCALAARRQLLEPESGLVRDLAPVGLLLAVIVWPVTLYYAVWFPDWSWLFLVSPSRLPWGTTLLRLGAVAVALLGGTLAGGALLRRGKQRELTRLVGALGGVALVLVLVAWRRLWVGGEFAPRLAAAEGVAAVAHLRWALGVTTLGSAGAAALTLRVLWREGRSIERRYAWLSPLSARVRSAADPARAEGSAAGEGGKGGSRPASVQSRSSARRVTSGSGTSRRGAPDSKSGTPAGGSARPTDLDTGVSAATDFDGETSRETRSSRS